MNVCNLINIVVYLMKYKNLLVLFLLMLFISPFSTIQSHPHVGITSQVNFVWNRSHLNGAWITWTFDAYFSADIIEAYDRNKDGSFNKKETESLYKEAFQNLKNYHYFTFIRIGNTRINPERVYRFTARQKGKRLVYSFYIDLSSFNAGSFYFANYDYSYYCNVQYANEKPVRFTYDPKYIRVDYSIYENEKYPVYYNPLGAATDTRVYYKWKPGLNTYYPRELHIRYVRK